MECLYSLSRNIKMPGNINFSCDTIKPNKHHSLAYYLGYQGAQLSYRVSWCHPILP
jgi:hypothetical protein